MWAIGWGMHLGVWEWKQGARHGATTENMKAYIDFAAEKGIKGVLAEGWNTGWENWGAKDAFDFTTPYSDFDLEEIVAYANEKGIEIIGHHETGGDVPTYEANMEAAFSKLEALGVNAVKTGLRRRNLSKRTAPPRTVYGKPLPQSVGVGCRAQNNDRCPRANQTNGNQTQLTQYDDPRRS